MSTDKTSPNLVLKNVKDPVMVRELIHNQVEEMKMKRRIRYGETALINDQEDDEA